MFSLFSLHLLSNNSKLSDASAVAECGRMSASFIDYRQILPQKVGTFRAEIVEKQAMEGISVHCVFSRQLVVIKI